MLWFNRIEDSSIRKLSFKNDETPASVNIGTKISPRRGRRWTIYKCFTNTFICLSAKSVCGRSFLCHENRLQPRCIYAQTLCSNHACDVLLLHTVYVTRTSLNLSCNYFLSSDSTTKFLLFCRCFVPLSSWRNDINVITELRSIFSPQ